MKSGMKKLVVLLGLAVALSLVFTGTAFANFGPHGGYTTDTDACAGCHRAHSSFSSLHFEEKVNNPGVNTYSLLVGNPGTMTEFCNACHGDTAPGASTNVVAGQFDSGPSGASGVATNAVNNGVLTLYATDSTYLGGLNGGGLATSWDPDTAALKASTSAHNMDSAQALWGAGNAAAYTLTCTGCHDPHGSTNYRLLKDSVNSQNVASMVFSYEPTYPDRSVFTNGWVRYPNPAAITQMGDYRPQYTAGTKIERSPNLGSLSTWCAACHTAYTDTESVYSYSDEGGSAGLEGNPAPGVNAPGGVDSQTRHRHPVDMTLIAGDGILQVNAQASVPTSDSRIPLELDPGNGGDFRANYVGCLTCHYAHGSAADMSGWSESILVRNAAPINTGNGAPIAADQRWVPSLNTGTDGVMANAVPASTSLLRTDDRGVCQRCHNK